MPLWRRTQRTAYNLAGVSTQKYDVHLCCVPAAAVAESVMSCHLDRRSSVICRLPEQPTTRC